MNDYYVYALLDTRKPGVFIYDDLSFDFEPFYIGKGREDRYVAHFYVSSLKDKSYKTNKIKRIINEGLTPLSTKIYTNLTEKDSLNLEKQCILKIKKLKEGGPLVNITSGGDGASGCSYIKYKQVFVYDTSGKLTNHFESRQSAAKFFNTTEAVVSTKIRNSKIYRGNWYLFNDEQSVEQITDLYNEFLKVLQKKRKVNEVVKLHLTKHVFLYNKNNELVKEFNNAKEAAEELGCKDAEIRMCCTGRRSRIGEYIVSYIETNINIDALEKFNKKVLKYNLNNTLLTEYSNLDECCRMNNKLRRSSITRCLKGDRLTYANFIWKYKGTNDE